MSVIAIIVAILSFLLLVVAHEFGHFSVAKLLGIRVHEFSVGMGPLIFKQTKGETQYSVRAIPLGGYCRFDDVDDIDEDTILDERSFINQSWWKKLLVLVAGGLYNIILALIIMTLLYTWVGTPSTTLGSIVPGSPAEIAGLQVGDKIVSVNSNNCKEWSDVIDELSSSAEDANIVVKRNGDLISYDIEKYVNEDGRYIVGITSAVKHSVLGGAKTSVLVTADFMNEMKLFFLRLFHLDLQPDDVVGVVGMVDIVAESAQYGIGNVILLMCILSLNLGIINLLPLPALDGGRILFVIIRAIFKGRISDEAEGRIHSIGMALLMTLMVYLIFKDTFRLILR